MAHARLKSISLKGFRSFEEESHVDLPENGMILFRGSNLDTKGSSGSGKSSVLLAISYVFGFCPYASTQLQSWLTEEPMEVVAQVQTNEGLLEISRGRKLALALNGTKLAGSAKQLEERLTQILGLPSDLLAALTYRAQKAPGLFLSKTDSEKKEFLTQLLDLGRFEAAVETSQAKAKSLEVLVETNKQLVASKKATVDSLVVTEPVAPDMSASQKALEEARSKATYYKARIQELSHHLRSKNANIETRVREMNADNATRVSALQEAATLLKKQDLDLSGLDLEALESLKGEKTQAQTFLAKRTAEDAARQKEQRQKADNIYAQMMILEKKLARIPQLTKQIEKYRAEIAVLEKDICDRCERTWDKAQAQKEIVVAALDQAVSELLATEALKEEAKIFSARFHEASQFQPSEEIEQFKAIIQDLSLAIAAEEQKANQFVQELKSKKTLLVAQAEKQIVDLQNTHLVAVEAYRNQNRAEFSDEQDQLDEARRADSLNDATIRSLESQVSRAEMDFAIKRTQYEGVLQQLERGREDLAKFEAAGATNLAAYHAEQDFQRLVGREGFLGAIFDEALWEISDETNRLLAQFPNTAHVTLHFRSEGMTQKGTIKKSIVPVISVNGIEAPMATALSGGMETAVELAVDLAVASVVSRRTGAVPAWLVLDESFTGLDNVGKEACMDILKVFASDKLVLVVDHSSELAEAFSDTVDVEYSNGRSKII